MASSSGAPKVCFNLTCNQTLEVPRRGWLCRTGDFADLCDRCGSAFEDGKFCDTYHLNASGWRCCESCGKQIHCGCIVSFHMFILLDAGGIECLKCAKTEYILTPNPTWPSASHFLNVPVERNNNICSKSWRSIAGSGPVPWRQAPTLFNAYKHPPELPVLSCTRNHPSERFVNSWRVNPQEIIDDKALASGMQNDGQHNLLKHVTYQSFVHNNAIPLSSLPATFVSQGQQNETGNVSGIHVKRLCTPLSVGKNVSDPFIENQTHNGTARGETRASHQLLTGYWPKFIDQELQQLNKGSNAKITPLFEKVLSVSDTGKIGRLVLPKKCAEAYLPSISGPEGYPLVIEDLKGKDWVLQYRFWPNNNSRMYVLEGVTPYLQCMQLQAGDTVTFGRLEPEGKLVMGFRKASLAYPSYKCNEATNTRISAHEESSNNDVAINSRNIDGTLTEDDKISVRGKRKKAGNMCADSKNLKHKKEERCQLSVTLEQVQGLLHPPLNNAHTVLFIDGVEFEAFQEAPIIGIPKAFSPKEESTPKHQEYTFPVINRETFESPNDTNHKSTYDPTHPEQVGNSVQNPTRSMYADIIYHTQMGNSNGNHIAGPADLTFKSQNIDLNIQPEWEEECYHVSDSMGIMSLVQESTQRYIKHQKLTFNGLTDLCHKNHDL